MGCINIALLAFTCSALFSALFVHINCQFVDSITTLVFKLFTFQLSIFSPKHFCFVRSRRSVFGFYLHTLHLRVCSSRYALSHSDCVATMYVVLLTILLVHSQWLRLPTHRVRTFELGGGFLAGKPRCWS